MDKKPWEMSFKKTKTKPWEAKYAGTSSPKTFYGKEAIKEVEKEEGRSLSFKERRVVEEEGFVSGIYKDDKGIETSGVGQTGVWMNKTFKESFDYHEQETEKLIPNYSLYPEYLQAELVQATYRGDIQQSPTFRSLMKNGNYKEAAKELLDHAEYKQRKAKGDDGVTRRLEALRDAVEKYDSEVSSGTNGNYNP